MAKKRSADIYRDQLEAMIPPDVSRGDISRATGLTRNTIGQFLAGKRGINTRKATKIHYYLTERKK